MSPPRAATYAQRLGADQRRPGPAVYLRGIPAQLDLAQMLPRAGPSTHFGTVEEIGLLTAAITLRNADTGEAANVVSLDFQHDVPEEGAIAANLLIEELGALRPGDYTGEITLEAKSPAGLPMNVMLRPAAQIDVSLTVPRPLAASAAKPSISAMCSSTPRPVPARPGSLPHRRLFRQAVRPDAQPRKRVV